MRIAIVSPGILPVPAIEGGAVETLIDTFVSRAKVDHCIEVYSVTSEAVPEKVIKDGNVTYFQTRRVRKKDCLVSRLILKLMPMQMYTHYLRYVKKKLSQRDYECIIIENRPGFIRYLAGTLDARLFLHIHNNNLSKKGTQLSYIPKYCSGILAVSQYIKNQIEEAYCDKVRIDILHNGIDITRFCKVIDPSERKAIRKRYDIHEDDFVIVFTGRFCQEKGVRELVEAFSMLNSIDHIVLLIVGSAWFGSNTSDSYIEKVKEIAGKCQNRIKLTGYVDNSEVAKIEGISDIAVLPSLWDDPLPLTIIEAMASSLPVITTNSGGIPEMCTSDTGFILERGNRLAQDIKDCILTLHSDRGILEEMGIAGRERVENFFSTDYFYNQYIHLISKK